MEDTDWEEEQDNDEESFTFPRFQFSLATLLWLMTGAAILFSLIAWWGAVPALFLIGCTAGTLLGLLNCYIFNLGFIFEDLRVDIVKCFIISGVILAVGYLITLVTFHPILLCSLMVMNCLIYWVGMKLAWPEIEPYEIVICGVCSLLTGLGWIALIHSFWPLV